MIGGVKGAAFGAWRELRTRDALAQVMRAVGKTERIAPSELTADQLRAVFDQFADPFGSLGAGRLRDMLVALGLSTPGAAWPLYRLHPLPSQQLMALAAPGALPRDARVSSLTPLRRSSLPGR